MSRADERLEGKNRRWQRLRKGSVIDGKRWIKTGVGLALCLGCLLLLGLILPRRHPTHPRAGAPLAAPTDPQTAFETSFAQAQQWYFRAQVIAKQQLEALEEWDPESIRGSAPEIFRRSVLARTRETGLAEAAAREAAGRAKTSEEIYRATRLLVHIESDLGHHKAELEQAKKLVALRPHYPEAHMLLERAVRESGDLLLPL